MAVFPLLLLASFQIQVDGLRPGETFTELAPVVEVPANVNAGWPPYSGGRIIDAFTGKPVAGATVEIWTEEIDATFGGFFRMGEATTGLDGHFLVRHLSAGQSGEKGRIRAPGYLTLSNPASSLLSRATTFLFPAPTEVPQIQFLDAQERPIPGARLTSTYSCSHDVPAFEVTADSEGIVRLPEFGLQDNVPDLRFRAAHYASIEYLSGAPALHHFAGARPYKVYRPRLQGIHLRILDQDSRGLKQQPVHVIDGEGFHSERTDKFGNLNIAWPYQNYGVDFLLLGKKAYNYLGVPYLPLVRNFVLRVMGDRWSSDVPTGTLVLKVPDLAEDLSLRNSLFHEDGWTGYFPDDEPGEVRLKFPAGRGFLMIGGPFSGIRQSFIEFKLESGQELALEIEVEKEKLIKILLPDDCKDLWLQAGETSLVEKNRFSYMDEDGIWVPADTELFLHVRLNGYSKVHSLGLAQDGHVYDLRKAVLAQVPPPPAESSFLITVPSELAEEGSFSVESAYLARDDVEFVVSENSDQFPGTYELSGPAGSAFLASFTADGYTTAWFRGYLPPAGANAAPNRAHLEPVAYASLQLESAAEFSLEHLQVADLEEIHPGPFGFIVVFRDGRRVGINLNLQAGEKRVLRIDP
jgi:hypothetical protein